MTFPVGTNQSLDVLPVALVRLPAQALVHACELTHIGREPMDFEAILAEHAAYVQTLKSLGLEVRVLPALESFPDSVFVEDPALVLDELWISTRPTFTREGEADALWGEAGGTLRQTRRQIQAPGALEGGDVLRIGRQLHVGLTTRTNPAGLAQLRAIVEPLGYEVFGWTVGESLHFKTACTALDDQTLLVNPRWLNAAALRAHGFHVLEVDPSEPFGANVLRIGADLVINSAFPATQSVIERHAATHGLRCHPVRLAEFGKAEAGLTCLSQILRR